MGYILLTGLEYTELTTLITTVGFPIVMCLLLFKHIKDSDTARKEEMDKMSDAIDNNTLALQRLVDMLDRKE